MKIKIITLVYILIIGTFSFSDEVFFSGGLSASADTGIVGFDSRSIKMQPGISADAFFFISPARYLKTGLSAGFIYAFSSDLDGGWSYPGFSGLETGFELRYRTPFAENLDIGTGVFAGWYRYNLTENFFFLPSIEIYPSYLMITSSNLDFFLELPVRCYFHRQADIFMSAGLKCRLVFK